MKNSVSYVEWGKAYSTKTFQNKNEYPFGEIVSYLMNKHGDSNNLEQIRVLDLGCGWGNNLKFLKDKGYDYYGIDFSRSAVKHCRKYFNNITEGSFVDMPYESNFFDIALDRMSIQHNTFAEVEDSFKEVFRVLKTGGEFFSTYAEKGLFQGYLTTFLNEGELRMLLKEFSVVQIDYLERSARDRKYTGRTNIIVAKK